MAGVFLVPPDVGGGTGSAACGPGFRGCWGGHAAWCSFHAARALVARVPPQRRRFWTSRTLVGGGSRESMSSTGAPSVVAVSAALSGAVMNQLVVPSSLVVMTKRPAG